MRFIRQLASNKYFILISLVTFFFSLAAINITRPLWSDEMISINTLPINVFGNPLFIGATTNLPMFFYVFKLWAVLNSNSTVFLRLLPLFFSIATLLVWFEYLKKTISLRAALIFGVLFASAPLQTYYATELRAYSLTQLLLSVQLVLMLKYIKAQNRLTYLLFIFTTMLGLLTHFSFYFFAGAEGMLLILLFLVTKAKIYLKLMLTFIALGILGLVVYFAISSNPLFAKSFNDLEIGIPSGIHLGTDISRLKEVFTFYYWFGLYYYYVDIFIQFFFKKVLLAVLLLIPVFLAKARKQAYSKDLAKIGFITIVALLAALLLENYGFYPFGGRHIMPFAVLFYVLVAFVFNELLKISKVFVIVPLLMVGLFVFFNLNLGCAHVLHSYVDVVQIFSMCR